MNGRTPLVLAQLAFGVTPNSDPKFSRPFDNAGPSDFSMGGAPLLDLLAPDIYLPNFVELAARYSRSGNPLFIPESSGNIQGAANAFYAIGQHRAMGYSPMGIDWVSRLQGFRPSAAMPGTAAPAPPADIEALPLPMAYAALGQLAPMILEHQSKGTIAAVQVN